MKYRIILKKEREGGYSAQCLEVPGAVSQGETKAEALRNAREALALVLDVLKEEARASKATLSKVEVDA